MSQQEIKSLCRRAVEDGRVRLTQHARDRMAERNLNMTDIVNVLRGGWLDESRTDYERDSWRYRMTTHRMFVVVATTRDFETPTIRVVTCARLT